MILAVFFLVIPIFFLILLGYTLKNYWLVEAKFWHGLNQLTYWCLFPCFLFSKTSTIGFNDFPLFAYTSTLLIGFFTTIILIFIIGWGLKISGYQLTSILQGAGRHNTFIPLAIASQVFAEFGASLGALATAILVPISNIVAVTMLTLLLNKDRKVPLNIFHQLIQNPIIIAIFLGLLVNYLGFNHDPIVFALTDKIGSSALTIILLSIGAGLQFSGLSQQWFPCLLSCFGKLFIFPVCVLLAAISLNLPFDILVIAMLFSIAPTSPAGYPLALQMGGDAPLIATIISLQTLLSIVILPTMIVLLYWFFDVPFPLML